MGVTSAGDGRPPEYEELVALLGLVVEQAGGSVTIEPARIAAADDEVGQLAFSVGEDGSLTVTVMA